MHGKGLALAKVACASGCARCLRLVLAVGASLGVSDPDDDAKARAAGGVRALARARTGRVTSALKLAVEVGPARDPRGDCVRAVIAHGGALLDAYVSATDKAGAFGVPEGAGIGGDLLQVASS